jgi:ATP-dependent Clp protease ATP-binding subunit ClpA
VVFLTRLDAGHRGAAVLEPAHLLHAIVREDQGELPAIFSGAVTSSGPLRAPEHPFFSVETASKILTGIEQLLPPQSEPIPDSTDMESSPAFSETSAAATALAKELHHEKVEPLHLVAAMLSKKGTAVAEVLEQAGISRDAVIAAIQS